MAAGYRGVVLGLPVFARLAVDGSRVHGRYFYERTGIDLPLHGSLAPDGAVHLVEGSAATPTGSFDGHCEPGKGAFSGRWQGKKTAGEFQLRPVPVSEKPVVATKRFASSRPLKAATTQRVTRCSYEETRVELFGLRDEGVERVLDREGAEPLLGAVLDPAVARGVEKCDEGFEAEVNETLVGAFRELATLEKQGWIDGGGAHPSQLDFARTTIDLRTGRTVTAADVFVDGHDPLGHVAACAAKANPFDVSMDAEEWRSHLDPEQFDLAEDGVHFFATGFPHVMAVLAGQGPVIGYDVLLRDGLLRRNSPVKRAWRGVEPAAKGKAWCRSIDADAGWR